MVFDNAILARQRHFEPIRSTKIPVALPLFDGVTGAFKAIERSGDHPQIENPVRNIE